MTGMVVQISNGAQSGEGVPAFGYVYVLSNPAMPGFVKLGCTGSNDVNTRVTGLYSTGVPLPFKLEFACRVTNFKEVESALHAAFAPNRPNPGREFFNIEPAQAIAILKLLHVEDVTADIEAQPSEIAPEEVAAGESFAARRPAMNFHEMGIADGAVLLYQDGETEAVVVGPRRVKLGAEELSLTAATQKLKGLPYSVQPSPFWHHNGKLLKELYDETYTHVG